MLMKTANSAYLKKTLQFKYVCAGALDNSLDLRIDMVI